jgi:adenylate kinase
MNHKTFILMGRSGCGKGTQSKLLMDYLKKISPDQSSLYIYGGAEFREFIKGGSETQKISKRIYDAGELQPEFLAVYTWSKVLVEKYSGKENLIFDGMPRKYHEAGVLHSILDFYKLNKPYVINLDISEEESISRLMKRGRIDDNLDDIKVRLSWYGTEVEPAINFYRDNPDYHFAAINGEQPPEKVHEDIIQRFNLK